MNGIVKNLWTAILLSAILMASSPVHGQSTRKEIIASREKRRIQLEKVLEQIDQKLANHRSGIKVLAQHQLEHLEHKIQAYQYQIVELDRELDDDEIQRRMEKAEELRRAREEL